MGGFDLLAVVGATASLISLLVQLKKKSPDERRELFPTSEKLRDKAREDFDKAWLNEDSYGSLSAMPEAVYFAIGRKLLDLEEGAADLILDADATTEEIDLVVDEMRSEICRLLVVMKKINAGKLPHRNWDAMWVKYGCSGLAA